MEKQQIADKLAETARTLTPDGKLAQPDVDRIDALAAGLSTHWPTVPAAAVMPHADMLTVRAATEIVGHESIVQECYKDSKGIWTWGIGVTEASGYKIMGFKDNPQTIEKCIEVYIDRLRKVYIPGVLKAFAGFPLTEAQFAAALSFNYNTGAIEHTDWVKLLRAGQRTAARKFLETHYLSGGVDRREAEAALFFDGTWGGNGMVTVWPVKKPSYSPNWAHPQRVDIRQAVGEALAA